jgi:Carboxypeptidase regulatory-like domain
MRYRIYIFLILAALFIVAGFWSLRHGASTSSLSHDHLLSRPSPQPPANVQLTPIFTGNPPQEILNEKSAEGQRAKAGQEKAFAIAFETPINFWGRVVDEKGNPVPSAKVKLGTADRPWETGSSYERATDAKGLFAITGVKGLSISIDVSKNGYYQTPRSRRQVSYAQPSGNKEALPGPENPMAFELRKIGEGVPLIEVTQRPIRLPKNGIPVELDFMTGQTTDSGLGGLKVECWTEDQDKNPQGRYTWRCRLSVPGGGLIERIDQFDFEAPAEGYKSSDEIVMLQSSSEWKKGFEKEYFTKLPDNRYARFFFKLTTGGEHFFVVTSYLNPMSGSRNLEYDPDKRINK